MCVSQSLFEPVGVWWTSLCDGHYARHYAAPAPGGFGGCLGMSLCLVQSWLTSASVLLVFSRGCDWRCDSHGASPIRSIRCRRGYLGRSFALLNRLLETPQGSFGRELDYPWGSFSVVDVAVGENRRPGWINERYFKCQLKITWKMTRIMHYFVTNLQVHAE